MMLCGNDRLEGRQLFNILKFFRKSAQCARENPLPIECAERDTQDDWRHAVRACVCLKKKKKEEGIRREFKKDRRRVVAVLINDETTRQVKVCM
jgi:hypothetical protein